MIAPPTVMARNDRVKLVWKNLIHVVPVPLHPSASAGVITLAVVLALADGLLAGALGSWRIARLRPADALARVA